MRYDFDKVTDRRGTGALKFDVLGERYGRADLLPLWVADMDFDTPPFVVEALRRRLDHPIFGYTTEPADFWPAVTDWIRDRHGWDVERSWLTYIPGIVKGIGLAINLFTEPGDKVIIQPPVYHPFRLVPEGNQREVVYNPLKETARGHYEMDLEHLEKVAADPRAKILILSNPHNPAGIAWSSETLREVARICAANGVLVLSDEIHSDMPLFGHRHTPFATVSAEAAACCITFAAPSKTFNIAGIVSSYAIVPNDEIRERFYGWLTANELNEAPIFSPIATVAAYRHGKEWLGQMLEYVEKNVEFVEEFCAANMPAIKPLRPEASFLVWLDCRDLGLPQNELVELFVDGALLALNDGAMFGPGGEGHMRLNVGTPRPILEEALYRLREALASSSNAAARPEGSTPSGVA